MKSKDLETPSQEQLDNEIFIQVFEAKYGDKEKAGTIVNRKLKQELERNSAINNEYSYLYENMVLKSSRDENGYFIS